jgi:Spy/CpxP family protein refolding chaperone
MVVAGVVVALAGSLALTAFAHGGPGGYGGPGGWSHHGYGAMGGPGGFIGRGIERMLDEVNATAEQRSQIKQITQAAAADLRSQREAHVALRDRAMQVFTQPNVDAAAVESLRQQMLAQHDQASKRMTQAMLDVSRVLTPQQRSQLAERMKQRREMMQRHWQERRDLEPKPASK